MPSQWTLKGLAKHAGAPLSDGTLLAISRAESAVFERFAEALSAKKIWLWSELGPRPPIVLSEHVRFSFHPTKWSATACRGFASLLVSSKTASGEVILDDIAALVGAVLAPDAEVEVDMLRLRVDDVFLGPRAQIGGWYHRSITYNWRWP